MPIFQSCFMLLIDFCWRYHVVLKLCISNGRMMQFQGRLAHSEQWRTMCEMTMAVGCLNSEGLLVSTFQCTGVISLSVNDLCHSFRLMPNSGWTVAPLTYLSDFYMPFISLIFCRMMQVCTLRSRPPTSMDMPPVCEYFLIKWNIIWFEQKLDECS
jgi:hypothetical protein